MNGVLDRVKVWALRIIMLCYGAFFAIVALGAVSPQGSGNVPLALLLAFTSGGVFTFTVCNW